MISLTLTTLSSDNSNLKYPMKVSFSVENVVKYLIAANLTSQSGLAECYCFVTGCIAKYCVQKSQA